MSQKYLHRLKRLDKRANATNNAVARNMRMFLILLYLFSDHKLSGKNTIRRINLSNKDCST